MTKPSQSIYFHPFHYTTTHSICTFPCYFSLTLSLLSPYHFVSPHNKQIIHFYSMPMCPIPCPSPRATCVMVWKVNCWLRSSTVRMRRMQLRCRWSVARRKCRHCLQLWNRPAVRGRRLSHLVMRDQWPALGLWGNSVTPPCQSLLFGGEGTSRTLAVGQGVSGGDTMQELTPRLSAILDHGHYSPHPFTPLSSYHPHPVASSNQIERSWDIKVAPLARGYKSFREYTWRALPRVHGQKDSWRSSRLLGGLAPTGSAAPVRDAERRDTGTVIAQRAKDEFPWLAEPMYLQAVRPGWSLLQGLPIAQGCCACG